MAIHYPNDRTTCMDENGPRDARFRVPGGHLQYLHTRDSRFPYLYALPTHALVHSSEYIKKILIHIVDTSKEARIKCAKFDDTLSVPLGPNALMKEYGMLFSFRLSIQIYSYNYMFIGLLELEPGTILFARPLREDGIYSEEDDIAQAWCLDG